MKKYVKPDLYFESFQLNQHIAACGYDLVGNSTSPADCSFRGDEDFGNLPVEYFLESSQHCTKEGAIVADRYCFQNSDGTEAMATYNS